MSVCAKYSGVYNPSSCVYIRRYLGSDYSLSPGGHVTVHFGQLVVADSVYIRKSGLLTLCEVDVLGTKVLFSPEGLFSPTFPNLVTPLPSNRHHRSSVDCLEGKGENYQVQLLLCATIVHSAMHTHMNRLTVLWIGFCLTGPISLCLDSFLYCVLLCVVCMLRFVTR